MCFYSDKTMLLSLNLVILFQTAWSRCIRFPAWLSPTRFVHLYCWRLGWRCIWSKICCLPWDRISREGPQMLAPPACDTCAYQATLTSQFFSQPALLKGSCPQVYENNFCSSLSTNSWFISDLWFKQCIFRLFSFSFVYCLFNYSVAFTVLS